MRDILPRPASRIALVTGEQTQTIISAAKELAAAYEENRCGMRLVQMNDLLQLCPALVGLGVVNSVGEVDDEFAVLRNTSFHKISLLVDKM